MTEEEEAIGCVIYNWSRNALFDAMAEELYG